MMHQYYIIYKPYLVLSQFSSTDGKQCLADFFKVPKNVYPIGRLDYDSEGLLLLSNDASLNHRLLHPSFKHNRTYWVQVDGAITASAIAQLQQGVAINIDGKMHRTLPCLAEIMPTEPIVPERFPPIRVRQHIPAPWVSLTLQEGKNRQVRKMTAQVGFPTLRLVRYSIEQLSIGQLQPGQMLEISKKTIYKKIFHDSTL